MLPKKRSMYGRSSGEWRRSGIDEAADELGQRVADIVGEVGLGVVELDPLPGGKAQLGQLGRREAAELAVANARQREPARPVRLERRLDRADHVVACGDNQEEPARQSG